MTRYYVVSLVLQLAHVLAAEIVPAVGGAAGLLGVGIPLFVGAWYGPHAANPGAAARGGFLIGLVPALVGLVVALALGQVAPFLLVAGSLASGLAGLIGALVGRAFGARSG